MRPLMFGLRRPSPHSLCRPGRSLALVLLAACAMGGPAAAVEQTASALFEALRPLVYQVRVVDIASGDKTTIGSGFRVGADGLIATNFHVVSLLVHDPDQYRLELIDQDDAAKVGRLVAVDVLHDLALVRDSRLGERAFALRPQALAQGERIYSMGNPHDLGMTIIEGNYNGPVKSSRFERLLCSGSLMPGLSGGPAFDLDQAGHHGDVQHCMRMIDMKSVTVSRGDAVGRSR